MAARATAGHPLRVHSHQPETHVSALVAANSEKFSRDEFAVVLSQEVLLDCPLCYEAVHEARLRLALATDAADCLALLVGHIKNQKLTLMFGKKVSIFQK